MPRWMLVEDEPDIFEIILLMYEMINITGVSFTTGEDLIDWVQKYEAHPDADEPIELALLDIRLPGEVDGIEIGRWLRDSPVLNDIVIVLMTAYHLNPMEEAQVLEDSGADMLVYKPLPRIKIFARALYQAIDRRGGRDH